MNESTSQRIELSRVLCVFGMIYVHVPTGDAGMLSLAGDSIQVVERQAQALLTEGFGRAGACLLSIISGYLAARSITLSGTSFTHLFKRRFWTLLLPMILWAIVTVIIYSAISLIRPTFLTTGGDGAVAMVMQYVNSVLFLTEIPYGPTMHLAFLRDLFVCIMLAPLIIYWMHHFSKLTITLLLAIYLLDIETVVILRPLVLLCFGIGIYLHLNKTRLEVVDNWLPLWIAGSVASSAALVFYNDAWIDSIGSVFLSERVDIKESVLYPISRLFGALAVWTLTAQLLRTRIGDWLIKCSRLNFATYCSHYLTLTLLFYLVWEPLFGGVESPLYLAWFLMAPVVAWVASYAIVHSAAFFLPAAPRFLTGGRTSGIHHELSPTQPDYVVVSTKNQVP